MSESALYTPIILAARSAGYAALVRVQSGRARVKGAWAHFAESGTPDLLGYLLRGPRRGTFVGLEVKLPGKKPTAEQLKRRAEIEAAGAIAGVVHSVTEALTFLRNATEQQTQ